MFKFVLLDFIIPYRLPSALVDSYLKIVPRFFTSTVSKWWLVVRRLSQSVGVLVHPVPGEGPGDKSDSYL